jgi:hypothetical protein
MQAQATKSEIPSSFAGALAAFASETASLDQAPQGDGLADDIAILSYESAIRAQAGYQPEDSSLPAAAAAHSSPDLTAPESATLAGNLKSASITIRMSQAECAQLKKRAAAAGLTISAYLRSCTFEAEALRAQVKEALAELRAATPEETQKTRPSGQHAPRCWWRPWPHAGSRSAQA